jgi:hypothetical protein
MDEYDYIKKGKELLKVPTEERAREAIKCFELALNMAHATLLPKVLILLSDAKLFNNETKISYDLLIKAKESMDAAVKGSIIQLNNLREQLGEKDIDDRMLRFETNLRKHTLFTYKQLLELKKQGTLLQKNSPEAISDLDIFLFSKIILKAHDYDLILYPFAITSASESNVSYFMLQENEEPSERSIPLTGLENNLLPNKGGLIIEDFIEPIKIGSDAWHNEINNYDSYQLKIINAHFSPDQIIKFKTQGLSNQDIYKKTKQTN